MIRKFRKKPIVLEAIQFDENKKEVEKFMGQELKSTPVGGILIPTRERDLEAPKGYFVFKGESPDLGIHFWPVAPDYVEHNYEEVSE